VPKLNSRAILLFVVLAAVIAGSSFAVYHSGYADVFLNRERLAEFIRAYGTHAALAFVVIQALQVVAAPVPGEITGFVGGVLFGPFAGVLYSTAGLTLGSYAAFMLARVLGRPLVERLVSAEVMSRYDYVMGHRGLMVAFLLFLLPGFPKDYLCYLLGLGHMRLAHFLAISVAGRLLGTVLLTSAGAYFEAQRYGALFTVTGVALVVVLVIMVYRARLEQWLRRLHLTHERRPAAGDDERER
jgi:uncharacterized membrane protein YdjX (TVP38/TMEM64 family)